MIHYLKNKVGVVFKVVLFASNFWNTTIIWQFFRVILNFVQECYYLENKEGVVGFTKSPWIGRLQNILLPLYFRGNVSLCWSRSRSNCTAISAISDRDVGKNFPSKKVLYWLSYSHYFSFEEDKNFPRDWGCIGLKPWWGQRNFEV